MDAILSLPDCYRCGRTPSCRELVDGGVETWCGCGMRTRMNALALHGYVTEIAARQRYWREIAQTRKRAAARLP